MIKKMTQPQEVQDEEEESEAAQEGLKGGEGKPMNKNRTGISMVYVTINSNEEADKLIKVLLDSKKVANVSKVKEGMYSSYRWEGKVVQDEPEIQLILKTKDECLHEVIEMVHQNHPYDCPECIAVPVMGGSQEYIDQVKNETVCEKPFIDHNLINPVTDFWFGADA